DAARWSPRAPEAALRVRPPTSSGWVWPAPPPIAVGRPLLHDALDVRRQLRVSASTTADVTARIDTAARHVKHPAHHRQWVLRTQLDAHLAPLLPAESSAAFLPPPAPASAARPAAPARRCAARPPASPRRLQTRSPPGSRSRPSSG